MSDVVQRHAPGPLSAVRATAVGSIVPGALGGITAILVPIAISNFTTSPELMPSLGRMVVESVAFLLPAAIGCWAATRVMRSRLRADAGVAGRRGVIAGAASVFAHMTTIAVVVNTFGRLSPVAGSAAGFLVGAAVAVTMFFPWLLSRDERTALREIEG